jgi:tryptophan synthase beta chain
VLARELGPDAIVLANLSGRGDKDVHTMEKQLEAQGQDGAAPRSETRPEWQKG